jgi:hypothetical protein
MTAAVPISGLSTLSASATLQPAANARAAARPVTFAPPDTPEITAARNVLKKDGETPYALSALGALLWARFATASALPDLNEAITLYQAAVSAWAAAPRPEDAPARLQAYAVLAQALKTRLSFGGDLREASDVLRYERDALALVPADDPTRALACAACAAAHHAAFMATSDVVMLVQAVDMQREALSLSPPSYPSYAEHAAALDAWTQRLTQLQGDAAPAPQR